MARQHKEHLNYRVNDVRRKLRVNQAKIDIASVDTSALQASLKAQLDAIRAKEDAEKTKASAESNIAIRGRNALAPLMAELAKAKQDVSDRTKELNRANLLKCVTAY